MGIHEFEVGRAYWACPAIKGQPRKILIPIGRCGSAVTFATVDDLLPADDGARDNGWGSEYATVTTDIGRYTVSAASPVAIDDAAAVLEIVRRRQGADHE